MRSYSRAWAMLRSAAGRSDVWLLVWFFGYLLLLVEPHLLFQAQQPPFSCTVAFLQPFLRGSGGLTRYLAFLLGQADVSDALGALVRTVEAGLIGLLTEIVLRRLATPGTRPSPALRLVPLVLFMLGCGHYGQVLLAGPMLIATLAAVAVYAARPGWWRYSLVTLAVVYGVAGASGTTTRALSLAAFAVPCACLAVPCGGGKVRGLGIGAAYLLLPIPVALAASGCGLSTFSSGWAFMTGPSPQTRALLVSLFAFYPLAAVALRCGMGPVVAWQRRRAEPAAEHRRLDPRLLRALTALALVGGVSLLTTTVTADPAGHYRALMDFYAFNGRWDEALIAASPAAEPAILTFYDVNRALYGQGQLGEVMFAIPQRPDGLLLPMDAPYTLNARIRLIDQYFELGRLNLAEYALHNTLVLGDDNPHLLSRLARLYLLKWQPETARLYLNVLGYNLVWRRWARGQLRALDADPTLSRDAEVQRLRSLMVTEDDLLHINHYADDPRQRAYYLGDQILAGALRRNPRNRMALEYLLGYCLLAGRPDLAAPQIQLLRQFGVTRLPRAWAEGMLVALDMPGAKPDLTGLTIGEEARAGYRRFKQIVTAHGNDLRAADAQLKQQCAGTYYLYLAHLRMGP